MSREDFVGGAEGLRTGRPESGGGVAWADTPEKDRPEGLPPGGLQRDSAGRGYSVRITR